MLTDVFIKRPILATVTSLVILLAGAIAIPLLPIARYPDLAPPSVTVSAFYNGANAQAVESAVTTPLEQVINGVEGMIYLRSSSTNSGFASITVTFEIGRDPDLAAVDVQNRVNQALGRMPADVRTNGISVTKNSTGFLGGLGFFSMDNRYDSLFISNYLDLYVRDAIKRVPGVGNVIIFGERKFAMRLWLDPNKLAGRRLTASDVVNALREQNVQVAAGSVGDSPASPDQLFQLSVRAQGRLTEIPEFENVVVKAGADGALVRVRDVGRVELGAENYSSRLRFGGLEASGIGIQLLPSANALDVFQGVQETMTRLEQNFPPGLEWRVAFDNVGVVRESIIEVLKTLAEAIVLVILVMFLFLQNWRSTLIPAITIPVSLIGTFAFVKLFGFSINTLTLFGIVLATGIVVDDAIVVIENIERHMREYGKSARRAALDAMREVFSAVVVIGIVLVAVFVPVAFFPGTTGRMYQQFSLTIAFAVVLSVINAITFTPALSALLLDKESHAHGWFFTRVNRIIDGGTNFYVRVVRVALRWRVAMLVLFAGLLWATFQVQQLVPGAFVPDEDEGYFITIVQAPAGASLEYTSDILKTAETLLLKQPEIAAVFSVGGFSFSGSAPNQGLMFTRLKDFSERRDASQSLAQVLNRLRGQLMGIPGALVIPVAPPSIQGLSAFGGFQFEILDQSGGDIGALAAATSAVAAAGNATGKVAGLYSSFTADDPQLVVSIDRDRARSLGVPVREVTDALQVLLGSQYVNDFDFNNRAYRVYVQADQQFRGQPSNLKEYYARASNGRMVALDTLVRVRETTAPQVISHFNMFRSTELQGAPVPGVSSGQALAVMEQVARETLPAGFDFTWAGQSLEEIQAGSTALYLFGLSIVLVYLVLAAQYESWVLPFIILLGVPLAVLGALSAQLLRGFSNDVFCQIGLVMLIGLAAKNSILIVEFAEQLRRQGRSIVDAALESARIRLRPILMTSLAFILGVLPLALATGAGAAARNSVGTAVAGGMLISTVLAVVFIPVRPVCRHSWKEADMCNGRVLSAPCWVRRARALARAASPGLTSLRQGYGGPPELQRRRKPGTSVFNALCLVLLLSAPGYAQDPPMPRVEFAEAVQQALAKNPSVATAATTITRAESLLQQANAVRRPTVSVGLLSSTLDRERGFNGQVSQPQHQATLSGNVSMAVLAPSRWAAIAQARDQVDIARIQTDEVRQQVAVAAAQTYLAVISQRRLVAITTRSLEAARAHLQYAQSRLAAGAGTRLNELRASQSVSADEVRLENARLGLRRAQEALGVILAMNGPVDAGAEPQLEAPPVTTLTMEDNAWMANRPDVKRQAAQLQAARRIVDDSRRDWFPTGTASFDPQLVTPAGLFQPSKTWRLTLSFTQPVFDGGQRRSTRVLRQSTVDALELGLTLVQIEARADVRLAQAAVESAQRAVDAATRAAQQANEVLRITTVVFEVGAATNIEVIDAQRSARDAEAVAAQSEDALRQARLDLLVALGRFPG